MTLLYVVLFPQKSWEVRNVWNPSRAHTEKSDISWERVAISATSLTILGASGCLAFSTAIIFSRSMICSRVCALLSSREGLNRPDARAWSITLCSLLFQFSSWAKTSVSPTRSNHSGADSPVSALEATRGAIPVVPASAIPERFSAFARALCNFSNSFLAEALRGTRVPDVRISSRRVAHVDRSSVVSPHSTQRCSILFGSGAVVIFFAINRRIQSHWSIYWAYVSLLVFICSRRAWRVGLSKTRVWRYFSMTVSPLPSPL